MMHLLLESTPRRAARGGWTVASVLTHAAIIASAVALTARGAAVLVETQVDDLIYVVPPPPPRPTEQRTDASDSYPTVPPVDQFKIVVPPVTTFNPGPGIPSGPLATFEELFSRTLISSAPRGPTSDAVFLHHAVDKIVAPRNDNPPPEYPETLRSAALEGEVVVTFVVDTTGRVEPASLTILRQTHPLFGESVRRWLARTRYLAAEAQGQRVRQLVQQTVGFSLRH